MRKWLAILRHEFQCSFGHKWVRFKPGSPWTQRCERCWVERHYVGYNRWVVDDD